MICLNGGALALDCILQRIYYGDYPRKTSLHESNPVLNQLKHIAQFGPFAYRSNAASYLNLTWPLALGLGLLTQLGQENLDHTENDGLAVGRNLCLIPCIILAGSSPFISSARGGALVMLGLLILGAISMMFMNIRSTFLRLSVSTTLLVGLGAAYYQGWGKLEPRLMKIFSDDMSMSGRIQIYDVTNKMIDEYPIFGSGPGSFQTVYMFEIKSKFDNLFFEEMSGRRLDRINKESSTWASWAHSDYLEFYLTFGKPGVGIIITLIVTFALQFLASFLKGPSRSLKWFCLLAVAGVATHAIFDFPLQVYCILTLCTLTNCCFFELPLSRGYIIRLSSTSD